MWRDWARAHRVFLLVAALSGVIAGAVLNMRSTDRANERANDWAAIAAPEPVDVPPSAEPISAADVKDAAKVVETGFTLGDAQTCQVVADPCPPESVTVSHFVTYGVVIENTSDQVLTSIPVTVTFTDRRKVRVAPAEGEPEQPGITRLAPGERAGIGATWELAAGEVSGIRVEVGWPKRWMSPAYEADIRPIGPLSPTVTDPKVISSAPDPGPSSQVRVLYEARLQYEQDPNKGVEGAEPMYGRIRASGRPSVILRDEQGEIVGGVRGPSIEMGSVEDGYEVDLTSESRTFPFFSSASAEVHFNEIYFQEVVDVD